MVITILFLIITLMLVRFYFAQQTKAIQHRHLLVERFDAFMENKEAPLVPKAVIALMFKDCLGVGFLGSALDMQDVKTPITKEEELEIQNDPLFTEFSELAEELVKINISLYWPLYIIKRNKKDKHQNKKKLLRKLENEWRPSTDGGRRLA